MGQTIGALVEFAITHLLAVDLYRNGLGGALDLGFEPLCKGLSDRMIDLAGIECLQQLLALLLIEQAGLAQRHLVIVDHGLQQAAQITDIALDGGCIEQRRSIGQRTGQLCADLADVQRQVELGELRGPGNAFELQFAQRQRRVLTALPGQHGLEQRTVGQAALRPSDVDHLFKGQILMRLGCQGTLADLRQQRFDTLIRRQVEADRQGVDEQPDQAFDLDLLAVGDRRTDHQVILPAQAAQQHGPASQQGHVQGGAMTLTEGPEPGAQAFIEEELDLAAGKLLTGRPRSVGGQHQQRWRPRQGLLPVGTLLLQQLAAEPAALPHGKIAILHRQRRQRIVLAMPERLVERHQFAGQHAHRPAIGNDMVQGQQQHMVLLGHADQPSANQRPVLQVERPCGFLRQQCLEPLLCPWFLAQVLGIEDQPLLQRGNVYLRLLAQQHEAAAQGFMALDDSRQRPLQCITVQRPAQTETDGNVVGTAGSAHLRQEPQPLLGEGQRQAVLARHRQDLRQVTARGLAQHLGHGSQFGIGEQLGQRQFHPQALTDLGHHAHGQQ